jgi:hypothetical protein
LRAGLLHGRLLLILNSLKQRARIAAAKVDNESDDQYSDPAAADCDPAAGHSPPVLNVIALPLISPTHIEYCLAKSNLAFQDCITVAANNGTNLSADVVTLLNGTRCFVRIGRQILTKNSYFDRKWTYSREKAAYSIEPSVNSRKKRSNNIEERPELMLSLSNYYDPWRGRLRAQGYPGCRFRRDLA